MNLWRAFPPFCALLWVCFLGCSTTPTFFSASSDAGPGVRAGSGDEEGGGGGASSSVLGGSPGRSPFVDANGAAAAQGAADAGASLGSSAPAAPGGGAGGDAGQDSPDASAAPGTNDEGRCVPGCCQTTDGDAAIALADSVLGFSGTQGRCGWSFGYLPLGLEPFTLLDVYGTTDVYSPTTGQTPTWEASTRHPPWLAITSTLQHPNRDPLAWIDRRWTSGVSGSIAIRGHVAKADAGVSGDGVRVFIRVAGAQIWQASLAFDDTQGKDFSLKVDVEVGTALDFIVDPGPTDSHDTTTFTAVVSR